ncbi:MAG: tetratricopeptide repeat protein [Candidatus Sumerlaeaceae bacterium]|nr:tetratricopeptide repeat protein [Candidatus Sumerlaeaceae bacterium]
MSKINRKRDIIFSIVTVVAVVLNGAGAFLNYVLWSEGLVARDLYEQLVDMAGPVAFGLVVTCFGLTALAYALGLDPSRKKRPHLRTLFLITSFFVFLGGYLLGRWEVLPENSLAFGAAAFVAFVLAIGWNYAEGIIGRLAIDLARKSYESAPASVACFWAKIGLLLWPSHRPGENVLALSLARLGKWKGAERFIEQAYQDGERDADLCHAMGEIAESRGDLVAAATYYEESHRLAPSTALFRKLISLLETINQKRKALELLQKLPTDERRHWGEHIRELTFEVGTLEEKRALCREYEHAEAPFEKVVACFTRILEQHPRDVPTLEALAELAHRQARQEDEKSWLIQLIAVCPEEPRYRRRLIEICRWQGRMDEILAQLDTLVDLGQATREERLEAANEHFTRGNYDRVETILAASPELNNSMEAAWLLAASHYERGNVAEAARQIQRARHLPEDNLPEIHSHLVSLEHRLRQYKLEEELEVLAEKVAQEPENLELRFSYLDRLVARGFADRAVVGLEELLTTRPELLDRILTEVENLLRRNGRNFRLLSYLSDLYLRQRQWDKVYELHQQMSQEAVTGMNVMLDGVQKILREHPSHPPSLLFMARHVAQAGDAEHALEYVDRYYKAGGVRDASVLQLEFDLAFTVKNDDRAIQVGHELLKLEPRNKPLLLALAELAAKKASFGEAAGLASRALALDPQDNTVRALVKHYDEQDRRARIAHLRQALTGNVEDDACAHLELGDLFHDFGELNDAIVEYQKAALGATCANIARAKLGYVLAFKNLHSEAEEILNEVELQIGQTTEEAAKLKALLFRAAELMEKSGENGRALRIYKRIFRIDAGYRDVVTKIEKLQHLEKK